MYFIPLRIKVIKNGNINTVPPATTTAPVVIEVEGAEETNDATPSVQGVCENLLAIKLLKIRI